MIRDKPKDFPELKKYKPTEFMLPTSHFDREKAEFTEAFIEMLPHTKGRWEGQPFWLLPWQKRIIYDVYLQTTIDD